MKLIYEEPRDMISEITEAIKNAPKDWAIKKILLTSKEMERLVEQCWALHKANPAAEIQCYRVSEEDDGPYQGMSTYFTWNGYWHQDGMLVIIEEEPNVNKK